MPTGALISGGLGALGALGSSLIGSSAAKSASDAQTALGRQALATQTSLGQQGLQTLLDLFNQAKGIAGPTIDVGRSVLGYGLNNVLGYGQDLTKLGTSTYNDAAGTLKALLTPGASMTDTLSQIPGFKFAQDWGQKAVQNIGTTTGMGGNVLKAGADYATGVAQQGWQGVVNSLLGLTQGGIGQEGLGNSVMGTGANISNIGAGLVGGPTNALIGGATGTGQSAFTNLNTLGSTIGNTTTGIGNATASGILGSANALAGGLTGATGAGANALFLSKLLGNNNAGGGGSGGYGIYNTGTSGSAAP